MDDFLEFHEKFPFLYKERPRLEFSVFPGWKNLILNLSEVLESYIGSLPDDLRTKMYCVQLKQKLGSLRLYMNLGDDYICGAIAMAEAMSSLICVKCGQPGQVRANPFIATLFATLCDGCFITLEKKEVS